MKRILELDVLRGFALLGLPVVHFQLFGHTESGLVGGAYEFVYAFFIMKFVALFSTLFGMGFVIQARRAEGFARRYRRRLLWLGIAGLLHGFLLFEGDILFPYAVGGALLYVARDWTPGRLFRWAAALFAAGLLIAVAVHALEAVEVDGTWEEEEEPPVAAAPAWDPGTPLSLGEVVWADWDVVQRKAYADGPLQTTMVVRAFGYVGWLFYATFFSSFHLRVLACFAVGAALMKLNVFGRRDWLKIMAAVGLPVGLVGCAAGIWWVGGVPGVLLDEIGSVFLAAGYFGAVALLAPALRALVPVGRMALSNYVLQSVAVNVIFMWFALDQFGALGHGTLIFLALGVFALQVAASFVWLRFFRMGPLEWAWRRFTYGRER